MDEASVEYSQVFDESEIEFLGKAQGNLVSPSQPCSSEIQVDGTVTGQTGTTARLYRDYQRPRKWGQVQRGVPRQIQFLLEPRRYPYPIGAL